MEGFKKNNLIKGTNHKEKVDKHDVLTHNKNFVHQKASSKARKKTWNEKCRVFCSSPGWRNADEEYPGGFAIPH